MTSLTTDDHRAVAEAFVASGQRPDAFTYRPKPGPPTPLRMFTSSRQVLTVAVSPAGRRQLTVEREGREWAAAHHIPTPEVVAAGPDDSWLLARLVTTSDSEGSLYVHAGLAAADAIMAAPPPVLTVAPAQWRGDRRTMGVRLARLAVGGVPLRRLQQARRAHAALPDRATAHGDFYRRNVLACPDGSVSVVDWEFVGPAPRWTDHLRFWSTLRREQDRTDAWQRITHALDRRQRTHVAVLGRYLVLRLLGENLAAPASQRDAADLAHARHMVRVWPDYETRLLAG